MSIAWPADGTPVRIAAAEASRPGKIAAIEFHHELAAAEPTWRYLESEDCIVTPYQRYEFLSSWHHHVGARQGVAPLIVTACDGAGRPILLLPFGYAGRRPLRTLQFLGGKHANTNLGLWNRDFAASADPSDIRLVIDRIAAGGHGIDLIALHRQPLSWNGIANPLLVLPHQPSPNDCCHRDLRRPAHHETNRIMRKKLRSKSRKLAELPGYRSFRATSPREVDRLLNWFFPTKATHLAAEGVTNAFADPGIEAFVREICRPSNGGPVAELHAIECDDELLAVFGGIGNGRRFSSMFNTYTLGPSARHSPGLVLLAYMVAELGERGFDSFDLGVGDATYKRAFCREAVPLFDSFLPLTACGHIAASGQRTATAVKRGIKGTPLVWSALRFTRRHLYAHR